MATLEDLPVELLQTIFENLSNRDERPTPWLIAVSSQSRLLRRIALPFIFRSVSVFLDEVTEDESSDTPGKRRTILDFLITNTHIAGYIKNIDVKSRMTPQDREKILKLKALFPYLKSLRLIRLRSYGPNLSSVLQEIKPTCGVAYDVSRPTFIRNETGTEWVEPFRQVPKIVSISVVTKTMSHIQQLFEAQPRLDRLSILTPQKTPPTAYPDLPHETYLKLRDSNYKVPPLTDLRLDGLLGTLISDEPDHTARLYERIAFLNSIQWQVLRSLALDGGLFVQRFLTHYGDKLVALRHLSLWMYNDVSVYDPYGEHPGGREATAAFLAKSPCAQNIQTLELRGCSLKFPMTCIKSRNLQSLRFHNYEDGNRSSSIIRPASDIRHLAQHCPSLCHLAIDFPEMRNLFHPTAIPGVDSDIAVYPFLQAISEIPKLSHLHLFPPYTRSGSDHVTYTQPFTDDDLAIRLFKHIKTYQTLHKQASTSPTSDPYNPPSPPPHPPPRHIALRLPPTPSLSTLTHLLISSDNVFVKFVSGFDAQSWTVTEANGRFFMTLRQAGKEYEQRQVWEGERRLWTQIRRDRFPRAYEGGFADGMGVGWWAMP